LVGEHPDDGRRRGNRGASAAARFPAKREGELRHKRSWRLWWRFGKGARGSVGPESKRKGRLTTAALMATTAGGVFSGARKEEIRGAGF
jgi:hypothetical protein